MRFSALVAMVSLCAATGSAAAAVPTWNGPEPNISHDTQTAPTSSATKPPINPSSQEDTTKLAKNLVLLYGINSPYNPTKKAIRDWNVSDLRNLNRVDFENILSLINDDNLEATSKILPQRMTAAQFHVALLRELKAKGWGSFEYDHRNENARFHQSEGLMLVNLYKISQNGGSYVTPAAPSIANLKPSEAVAWVAAVNLLAGSDVMPIDTRDILRSQANSTGKELEARGVQLVRAPQNDTRAFGLGYALGGISSLNPKDNPAGPSVSFYIAGTPTKIQGIYCSAINEIHETGVRVNLADAFKSGFAQARMDASNNVQSGNDIGLFGICP